MVDLVGLRFVTTGEKQAIQALKDYHSQHLTLAQLQDKHVAAFNRVIRAQEQARRAYNQLAGSMDPAVAATNRLQAAQKVLQNAFDQGVISAQKKAAMLRQLNAQYQADTLSRYAAAQRKVSDTIIQGDAVVKRLNTDMQALTDRLQQGTITTGQHRTALVALARQLAINNNYTTASGALNVNRARAELLAAQAARTAAAADAAAAATKARLTQSYRQLMAAMDPAIARQQQMRQTIDMLRAAVRAKAITAAQASQALRQYAASLDAAADEARRLDDAQQLATRGMSRLGVLTQQAGYQFGDFFVQIQSGADMMMAFGQQATQLIGTFAMLAQSTQAIAIFSALGVIVPIVTAIAGAISRARESTQETAFDMQAFGADIMASLQPIAPVIDAIGGAASAVGSAFGAFANMVVSNLDTILVASAGIAAAFIGPIVTAITAATTAMVAFTVATLSNPIVLGAVAIAGTIALVYELSKSLGSVGAALGLVGQAMLEMFSLDSLYNGLRSLNARIISVFLSLVSDLASHGGKLVTALGEPFNQVAAIAMGTVGGIREVWRALPPLFQNVAAEAANYFIDGMEDLAASAVAALNAVIDGLNRVLDFIGADKALEWFGFSGSVDTLTPPDLSSWRASVNEQARGIGEAFSAGFANGYDQSIAATPVLDTLEALVAQADSASATFGAIADAFGAEFLKANPALTEIIERIKTGDSEVSALSDYFSSVDADTKGSGKGSKTKEQEDYLGGLLAEAKQKRRLVGLTEEETRRQEILFELKKRKLPVDEERIATIVATESYTRSLMEAEQQRQQLMQTVEGHIENAFMSMVDGSASVEDAFKGMLRNILLAIYQQEVAKPAATAVGTLFRGLLGFADGGAFSKGVQFFANGGVVNSPTMFQHSGGLGVMGEAGAEAIMPLKRGSDGKLGVAVSGGAGGDTINVHQYFQLSANGDESVRRIVRQEAPRMAEMAKSAVVDAKRRGGSYGRSF